MVEEKLKELGLELPKPSVPGGAYSSVNKRQNIAYLAIQFPIKNEEFHFRGRLGEEINTEEGYEAMQMCVLNVLSHVRSKIGFENIEGLNHIDIYFQAAANWDESPKVANGASDLFLKTLGEKGEHSRAIFGVDKLPRNFCVGLTVSFTLKN